MGVFVGFFSWRGEIGCKYHYKRADDSPTLNAGLGSFVIFQESQTNIAKKSYTFVSPADYFNLQTFWTQIKSMKNFPAWEELILA